MPRRRAHNARVNLTAGERADKRRGTGKPKPKPRGATQGETAPTDVPWYVAAIEDEASVADAEED